MDTQDVISFYIDLLIFQYASLSNAISTMQLYVGELLQNQIISQLDDAFDLTTAIGNQLNILGSYRGVNREIFGLSALNYWALVPDGDPSPGSYYGWAADDSPPPNWYWFQESDFVTLLQGSVLTDSQMRRLIKFKAMIQSLPLTLGEIDNILYATFGIYVNLVDNLNMTMTYQHQAADPDPDNLWAVTVLANALPHPCGVSFNVVVI